MVKMSNLKGGVSKMKKSGQKNFPSALGFVDRVYTIYNI